MRSNLKKISQLTITGKVERESEWWFRDRTYSVRNQSGESDGELEN